MGFRPTQKSQKRNLNNGDLDSTVQILGSWTESKRPQPMLNYLSVFEVTQTTRTHRMRKLCSQGHLKRCALRGIWLISPIWKTEIWVQQILWARNKTTISNKRKCTRLHRRYDQNVSNLFLKLQWWRKTAMEGRYKRRTSKCVCNDVRIGLRR